MEEIKRDDFAELIREKIGAEHVRLVMLAYKLSEYGHNGQKRDGGGPYFDHTRGTALILLNEADIMDPKEIIGGLLHDTLEDSTILDEYDIEFIFGRDVCELVRDLTKRPGEKKKTYLARLAAANIRSKRIKLADRLYNLRDLKPWSKEKITKYCKETENYIMPWAREVNEILAAKLELELSRNR